jgi:triosephosphate isomerase
MRKRFVAGNWKMFTNSASARKLGQAVAAGIGNEQAVTVAVCPPFPYLTLVAAILRGTPIRLGAQNCYSEDQGAFTGEVSPAMVADIGCDYVILGHSERRQLLGETDEFINRKVRAALAAGLRVILCIGETLEQRDGGKTEKVLDTQLCAGLKEVSEQHLAKLTVAYEPVWAIGTGRNASPQQAQQAHAFLRCRIGELYNRRASDELIIQYGGSVKRENATTLMEQPDVDGALVGGASLEADQFLNIVQAAASPRH